MDLDQHSPAEQAVDPLPYATPMPHPPIGRFFWIALVATFLLAGGVGLLTFGALTMIGVRDDHAGPLAVGSGAVVLGGMLLTYCWRWRDLAG